MLYALFVAAMIISIALTVFLAFLFRIQRFSVLVLIDFTVAFLVTAGLGFWMAREIIPGHMIWLAALGVAAVLAGILLVIRYVDRSLHGSLGGDHPYKIEPPERASRENLFKGPSRPAETH